MRIDNEFTVDAPISQAWALLTDIGRIAPCLPGAQLTGSEGGVHQGMVRVKVGPITAEYKGTAEFIEKDDVAYLAVIDAKGRDTRGAGNAAALISVGMTEADGRTHVVIGTDLKISGKVAQFGRGVIVDVSEKLLGQFVECLEMMLASDSDAVSEAPVEPQGHTQPQVNPEPLDLMKYAGRAVTKRLLPVILGLVALVTILLVVLLRA